MIDNFHINFLPYMKAKIIYLLLIFLIFIPYPLFADVTVTKEGYGAIINNEIQTARDEAIMRAQRDAIQDVFGVDIISQDILSMAQMVDQRIILSSRGYVKDYEIIGEKIKEDLGLYCVTINATIAEFVGDEQKNFIRPFSLLIGVDLIVDDKR